MAAARQARTAAEEQAALFDLPCPACGLREGRHHPTCPEGYRQEPRAVARRTDPDTSHEAAASLPAQQVRASQEAVLDCLRRYGAMTDEQIAARYEASRRQYGWPAQSPSGLRTRRAELVDQGLVEDSGLRRELASGRRAIVWRPKPSAWTGG
ncbi:MAG: hypothetical protein QN174_07670 [Armatimonadota bacterium]|nr:hypothetical protein [Armatimonadota bacterium]